MTGRSEDPSGWKRLRGWLLSHLLGSLFGSLFTAGIVVRAVRPMWDSWNSLPGWLRVAICVAAIVGLAAAWRYQTLRRRDAASVSPNAPPSPWGYDESGQVKYAGVVWQLERPSLPPGGKFRTEEVEAESYYTRAVIYERPQCPRCTVTLSQRRRFWGGGFVWSCPGCDFRIHVALSWTAAAAEAQAFFRLKYKEAFDEERAKR